MPGAACFYARLALEVAVGWLYERDSTLRDPYETTLAARIHEPTFRRLVGNAFVAKARIIKDLGNAAVHETRAVPPDKAVTARARALPFRLLADAHLRARGQTAPRSEFSPQALPRTTQVAACHAEAASGCRQQRYEESVRGAARGRAADGSPARRSARPRSRDCRLRAEIAAREKGKRGDPGHARLRRSGRPATPSSTCCCTRPAGRSIKPRRTANSRSPECPTTTGEGFVDYVLWGDDGKPLGLVEAKRTTARRRGSASSRPSSMPTAWKSSSASGR